MVLPLLLIILLLIVGVSSVYSVRTSAHKMAYDAARHVAKSSSTHLIAGCGTDLKDERPPSTDPKSPLPSYRDDVQDVIDYYYTGDHANHMLQAMTSDVEIASITTGPPINVGPHSQPSGYYCNQSIQVTMTYKLKVPAWEVLKGLLSSQGETPARETGVAARLANEFEVVPCSEQPDGAKGC